MRTSKVRSTFQALAAAALLAGVSPMAAAGTPVAEPASARDTDTGGDPFGSLQWPALRHEYLGDGETVFDPRVQVRGPAFAEDPQNVPISVDIRGLEHVQAIVVLVDRNPIRRVLAYYPLHSLPQVSFRFKLEQASPVRAAARTADGVWHVGGTLIDSAGGGCTVPGVTRQDGSWTRSLGSFSARVFAHSVAPGAEASATRVRLRVMHPMDTGLVAGIPAFYLTHLSLRDAHDQELMRLDGYEPISENPVFSFDFASPPDGPLRLVGQDNDGNRIDGPLP